jgi:hypothetical protein
MKATEQRYQAGRLNEQQVQAATTSTSRTRLAVSDSLHDFAIPKKTPPYYIIDKENFTRNRNGETKIALASGATVKHFPVRYPRTIK